MPGASAGDQEGYLDGIKVYADERPEGLGPVGVCVRTGKPCIIYDFVDDPRADPWRERAIAHGIRSAAALPLGLGGEVCGVFIVYAGEKDVFQDREVGLLEEIADSISFAMDHLEQEKIDDRPKSPLAIAEAQYRAVIETCYDGFWMTNEEGRILEVNDAYVRCSGYRREELVGMHISALEAKEQPAETAARIVKIRQNGTDLFESLHRAKDGTVWPVEVNAAYRPAGDGHSSSATSPLASRPRRRWSRRSRLAALGADIGIALTRGDPLREVLRSCSRPLSNTSMRRSPASGRSIRSRTCSSCRPAPGCTLTLMGPTAHPCRTSEGRPDCPRASAAPDQRRDRRSARRQPRMGPAGRDGLLRWLSPGREGSSCRGHRPIRADR